MNPYHHIVEEEESVFSLRRVVTLDGKKLREKVENMDEDYIVQGDLFEDTDPNDENLEGYTNNEGCSATRWYRKAVMLLVSQAKYMEFTIESALHNKKALKSVLNDLLLKFEHDPDRDDAQAELTKACRIVVEASRSRTDPWGHRTIADEIFGLVAKCCSLIGEVQLFEESIASMRNAVTMGMVLDIASNFELGDIIHSYEDVLNKMIMKLPSFEQKLTAVRGLREGFLSNQVEFDRGWRTSGFWCANTIGLVMDSEQNPQPGDVKLLLEWIFDIGPEMLGIVIRWVLTKHTNNTSFLFSFLTQLAEAAHAELSIDENETFPENVYGGALAQLFINSLEKGLASRPLIHEFIETVRTKAMFYSLNPQQYEHFAIPYLTKMSSCPGIVENRVLQRSAQQMMSWLVRYYVNEFPEGPKDWSRPLKIHQSCGDCKSVNLFLGNPHSQEYRFSAHQNRITHVAKKVVPLGHTLYQEKQLCTLTLVIKKSTGSYEQEQNQWRDRANFAKKMFAKFPQGSLQRLLGDKYDTMISLNVKKLKRFQQEEWEQERDEAAQTIIQETPDNSSTEQAEQNKPIARNERESAIKARADALVSSILAGNVGNQPPSVEHRPDPRTKRSRLKLKSANLRGFNKSQQSAKLSFDTGSVVPAKRKPE
ncbi:MAG: hypothetical protein M1831_004738 [Alyxoria varia]|nr:MAG: hypothetical protein M1831_004738 [Alyxoria varia]